MLELDEGVLILWERLLLNQHDLNDLLPAPPIFQRKPEVRFLTVMANVAYPDLLHTA